MSSIFDGDVATLHNDCNLGQTLASLPNDTLQRSLENLLLKDDACLCTFREVLFHLDLENIDIRCYSKEEQVQFLTRLMSERFHSTCFTGSFDICIRCSLSPDLEVSISNGNVEELNECALELINGSSQIPDSKKLHLAVLAKDHQRFEALLKAQDPKENSMFIFYGISCGEIIDILVDFGVDVNKRDARRRTPLFYALTSSLDSAKKILDEGALVTARDNCNVSVLTFFAENMLKKHLAADVKVEGIKLLCERENHRAQMIKDVINWMLCKFVQVLGTMQPASVPQGNDFNARILCDTLETILDGIQTNDHENLINQLQSMKQRIDSGNFVATDAIETFYKLGAKSSAADSEGNTSLHYATQLLFYGVPEVTEICHKLLERDAKRSVKVKNHKKETPLLFCLSSKDLMTCSETSNWSGRLEAVCSLLMNEGAELCDTTHKYETAFQLILKHCQYALLLQDQNSRRCIFQEMLNILKLFSQNYERIDECNVAVNSGDIHLNTPLHLWASMAMKPPSDYRAKVYDDVSFEDLLAEVLQLLRNCGVKLNDQNNNDETPLHMCRTWTAVKLLTDAGANPDVTDSSGCTPLLAAAKRNTCIKKDSELFYPDVTQTPKEFWKDALDKKLDPWSTDNDGNSVLSILIQKEANCLAKTLVEVACEKISDAARMSLLIAVCKDQSSENWKLELAKLLLGSRRSLVHGTLKDNNDTPLHFSCRNILELPERGVEDCVHWKIANYLLECGADVDAAGETGESCLALSDNCPALEGLLSTPVDHSTLPLVLGNWQPSSQSHYQQLSLVARMVKCQQVGSLYFYPEALHESKSLGNFVFPGIDHIGREVAVKRIDKSKMLHNNGEESVLTTSQCQQVIQYLFCVEDENFRYIAFELMEGDLESYLDNATHADDTNKFCKDLVMGLHFLQSHGIVHGNISPRTVFYHTKPNWCLKIGNCKTGSSRRGWVAAEVLNSTTPAFSDKSDVFSCGLVLHYLLSGKIHPFAPADSATKPHEEVLNETERNIMNGDIVKIDDSLSPEATDLVSIMLDREPNKRPSAAEALKHPFFWDKKTKKAFISVVANEPEFERVQLPLTKFEDELEGKFSKIAFSQWNDPLKYGQISATYNVIPKGIRTKYNFKSVADLLRFIRNTYQHINEHDVKIQAWWNKYGIFDYFPCLVLEVYNTVKAYNLHTSRPQIKGFLNEL